jgi:hypothetical protein
MSFVRTHSGLSNLHLFHGVDAVVFVEGGSETFTLDDLEKGLYSNQAADIKYWQIVFSAFAAGRTFHFRAVGSKNTINGLADLIATGKLKRVFVARDRDLDNLSGVLPVGAGIFTTQGYSWENDVWTAPIVFATFRKFNTVPEKEDKAREIIEREFLLMYKGVRGCVCVDAILACNNLEPLPRDEFLKIVRVNGASSPVILSPATRSLLKRRRLKVRPQRLRGSAVKPSVLRDCYGHLLEAFGYHLLVHVLNKICGLRTTPKELLVPAAIDTFSSTLTPNEPLVTHYSKMFAALVW